MDRQQTVDVLRTEGIKARGYGVMPQIVARDERLKPEAKAIYAYFCSFAGAGFNPVFPTRKLMLQELNMSKDRYYKNLKQLVDLNYITIERCRIGNLLSKNIYSFVEMPDADGRSVENETIKVRRPARIAKRLEHKQKAPSELVAEDKSAAEFARTSEKAAAAPGDDRPGKVFTTAGKGLALQLGIKELLEKRPEHKDLINYIFMTIEDMMMSEQVTVSGSIKKKEAIRQQIEILRMEHIECIVNNITQSGQTIKRKKAYLQSCIWNICFDLTGPLDFSEKRSMKHNEEEPAENQVEKQKDLYKLNPELKDLDDQIFTIGSQISRAILSGNELQTKALRLNLDRLNEKREEMISQMNAISNA